MASMQLVRRAVIDVGTNSVKLLVGEANGVKVIPCLEMSLQTRLGRGFYPAHKLQAKAIAETAGAVMTFARTARDQGAVSTRVIATSAARDAVNAADLVAAIQKSTGLEIEIISGEKEAQWAYRGIATDPRFAGKPLLVIEVGGGSTQVVFADGKNQPACHSFKLGSVRLLEKLSKDDPPPPGELAACRAHVRDFLNLHMRPAMADALKKFPGGAIQLVGSGGTASVLCSMHLGLTHFDREAIESVTLLRSELQTTMLRLWSQPLAERQKTPGLPPDRADVILTGIAIHEVLMDAFDFKTLRASTRGIRFAALLEN
jgi:exopolyphosphatase/guanosine-5'-triphosphate,3'-diphosphate pyrophosphatase